MIIARLPSSLHMDGICRSHAAAHHLTATALSPPRLRGRRKRGALKFAKSLSVGAGRGNGSGLQDSRWSCSRVSVAKEEFQSQPPVPNRAFHATPRRDGALGNGNQQKITGPASPPKLGSKEIGRTRAFVSGPGAFSHGRSRRAQSGSVSMYRIQKRAVRRQRCAEGWKLSRETRGNSAPRGPGSPNFTCAGWMHARAFAPRWARPTTREASTVSSRTAERERERERESSTAQEPRKAQKTSPGTAVEKRLSHPCACGGVGKFCSAERGRGARVELLQGGLLMKFGTAASAPAAAARIRRPLSTLSLPAAFPALPAHPKQVNSR